MMYFVTAGLWSGQCLSVRFTSQQALYVIKGQDLTLQAQIELLDREHVVKVTWDHAAKTSGTGLALAEFPREVSDGRVTLEQQGATLKIRDYQAADAGVYTVTVTDQSGQRRSAQRTVQQYRKISQSLEFISHALYWYSSNFLLLFFYKQFCT